MPPQQKAGQRPQQRGGQKSWQAGARGPPLEPLAYKSSHDILDQSGTRQRKTADKPPAKSATHVWGTPCHSPRRTDVRIPRLDPQWQTRGLRYSRPGHPPKQGGNSSRGPKPAARGPSSGQRCQDRRSRCRGRHHQRALAIRGVLLHVNDHVRRRGCRQNILVPGRARESPHCKQTVPCSQSGQPTQTHLLRNNSDAIRPPASPLYRRPSG